MALLVPDGWTIDEYENSASFAAAGARGLTVDVNVHDVPGSEAVGVLALLTRSPGLRLVEVAEASVGGCSGWRYVAEADEDLTYDAECGEMLYGGDRTVVFVAGVGNRVVAIHASAPAEEFGEHAATVASFIDGVVLRAAPR